MIVPNPESSLNEEASRLLLENYEDYFKHAKLYTSIHAQKQSEKAEGIFHLLSSTPQSFLPLNLPSAPLHLPLRAISIHPPLIHPPLIHPPSASFPHLLFLPLLNFTLSHCLWNASFLCYIIEPVSNVNNENTNSNTPQAATKAPEKAAEKKKVVEKKKSLKRL